MQTNQLQETTNLGGPPPRNRRILIIDDNPKIQADFRKVLLGGVRNSPPDEARQDLLDELEKTILGDSTPDEKQQSQLPGFEVDSARQGQQGLTMLTAALDAGQPYALGFVDMRMPDGWDGVRTIEELWKKDPDLQVVICTAYSDRSWT
jgi:CheY-like chemotaxis protein